MRRGIQAHIKQLDVPSSNTHLPKLHLTQGPPTKLCFGGVALHISLSICILGDYELHRNPSLPMDTDNLLQKQTQCENKHSLRYQFGDLDFSNLRRQTDETGKAGFRPSDSSAPEHFSSVMLGRCILNTASCASRGETVHTHEAKCSKSSSVPMV